MKDMNIKEVTERLLLFKDNHTYTFILNIYSKFFNGYVIEVREDTVLFKDDMLGEIPILLKEIKEADYSLKKRQ